MTVCFANDSFHGRPWISSLNSKMKYSIQIDNPLDPFQENSLLPYQLAVNDLIEMMLVITPKTV